MGKRLTWLTVGVLVACCGPVLGDDFPYRYYSLISKFYDGTLQGEKPTDDLDFRLCEPKQGKSAPCIVVFKDEFLKLKQEYRILQAENKDLRRQLDECRASSR